MEIEQLSSLATVVISVAALFVAWRTVNLQHKHNVLSVRPFPQIALVDDGNKLRIKLINHGHGPLFIKSMIVSDGTTTKETLIAWMPTLTEPLDWSTFTGKLINRSMPSGGELTLLELRGDTRSQVYSESRDECRRTLAKLTVSVEYTDIYGTKFETYTKSLRWFGRKS